VSEKLLWLSGAIQNLSLDPDLLTKIDEKANLQARGFQIINELSFMGWIDFFHGFEFEDDFVFHNEICDIITDNLPVVTDLDSFFLFKM
jgi:hypothetical protein